MTQEIVSNKAGINRLGVVGLVLDILGLGLVCMTMFMVSPGAMVGLALATGGLGLAAGVLGVLGLRVPVQRWTALLALVLGVFLLLAAVCLVTGVGFMLMSVGS